MAGTTWKQKETNTDGSGTHIRPKTSLVLSQYMGGGPFVKGFRRCGLAMGRKEVYFRVSAGISFGEILCWDDIFSKRGKHMLGPLNACHRSRCKKPSTLIHLGGGKAKGKGTK